MADFKDMECGVEYEYVGPNTDYYTLGKKYTVIVNGDSYLMMSSDSFDRSFVATDIIFKNFQRITPIIGTKWSSVKVENKEEIKMGILTSPQKVDYEKLADDFNRNQWELIKILDKCDDK